MVPKMKRKVSPKILKLQHEVLLLLNNFRIKPIIKLIQLITAIRETIQVIQTFIYKSNYNIHQTFFRENVKLCYDNNMSVAYS